MTLSLKVTGEIILVSSAYLASTELPLLSVMLSFVLLLKQEFSPGSDLVPVLAG